MTPPYLQTAIIIGKHFFSSHSTQKKMVFIYLFTLTRQLYFATLSNWRNFPHLLQFSEKKKNYIIAKQQQKHQKYYIMSKKKLSKVIILGDSAVGKTSLLNSYVDQKFVNSYKATVGADFMEKEVIVEGKVINLEIWDTAGQEKFRSLGGAFYRGADCCVLVYDITNKKSFDNIDSWIQEFLNQGSPKEPEKFPFILVGNKIDRQSQREVQEETVNQFLQKHPKIKHLLTSAKNSEGVSRAFEKIALASIENKQQQIFIPVEVPSTKLKTKKKETAKKKGCC